MEGVVVEEGATPLHTTHEELRRVERKLCLNEKKEKTRLRQEKAVRQMPHTIFQKVVSKACDYVVV